MKLKFLAAALLTAGIASTGASADTATLTVNATVIGICKFATTTGTLVVKNQAAPATGIDPSSATAATGASTLTYRCTKGQTPTFAAGQGAHWSGTSNQVKHATLADVMPYSLTLTGAGAGTGFGAAAQTLNIAGTITAANFQNVSVGAYSDTVTLTVTP